MSKFIYSALSLSILFSTSCFGQHKQVLEALFGSQEEIKTKNIDPIFGQKKQKAGGEKMESAQPCTTDEQTSLPLRVVLGLLRGEGAVLSPSFDENSGTLSVYGGPMIGNCNDMLEYHLDSPTDDLPYTFEVRIKRPSGCSTEKCKYSAFEIQNEEVVEVDQKLELEPNYNGFIECLKQTNVFENGKINKSKVVTTEMNVEKSGVNQSGDVWFASRGPEALNTGGGIFSVRNKHPNSACYFYEDIKEDGYSLYTKEDVNIKILNEKAANLCKSKNYEEIYNNLKNFESMSSTYKDLEKIAKKELLKEVKKAKKKFDEAVKKGDLSELDTEKYAKLFKDFYSLIVEKHLNEEAHNNADENDMGLLVNLYSAYEDAETEEEKAQIEKQIRDLTKELNEYMSEPYFTTKDYQHFVSLKNKAPIKDPKWKDATEFMHKSMISLRLTCQAYSVDNKSCSFKDREDNMKDMATVEQVNDRVAHYASKAAEIYDQREFVLKNPDADNSETFGKLISDCQKLYSENNQKQMQYRQTAGQYNMLAQQQCKNKNPYMGMFGGYGGYYTKKFQECVEDMNLDYKAKFTVSKTRLKVCDTQIAQYKDEYDKWKDLEDLRDRHYYGDNNANDRVDYNQNTGSYSFNFTPGQVGNNGHTMPNQFNPNMQMNNQMGMYNPGMYNMGMNPMMGMNSGFGMNAGFGMNPMMGMNSGFGMNAGFGMNPMMGMNSGFGMNYGMGMNPMMGRQPSMYGSMGMPGAMQSNMGYMTSPTGGYNFNF